jgi:galactose mutarotase-like enzyme
MLAAGELEAIFVPAVGMVCRSLRSRGEELLGQRRGLDAYATRGKTFGIPLLHPWANRLGAWRLEVEGRPVELEGAPVSRDEETGLPLHGLLPRPWTVAAAEPARVVAVLDPAGDAGAFPFAHALRLEASLSEAALRIAVRVEAHDDVVPVAFGFHPYLTLPGVVRADYEVSLPVRAHLALDECKLPTGEVSAVPPFAGRLGERGFDDAYEAVEPEPFVAAGGGRRLEVRFEAGFPSAQVFAPPEQDLICFEPMTARTDALRAGGYPVARPGAPYEASFSITVA